MSLSRRDEFAKAALAGLLANPNKHGMNGKDDYAETAIGLADALLAALGESEKSELVAKIGVEIAGVEQLQKRLAIRERQLEVAMKDLDALGHHGIYRQIEAMGKERE